MKKTIIAAAFASATLLGFSSVAFAEYDLGKACSDAYNAESGIPTEVWAEACSCLVGKAKENPDIATNLEAADGDESKRSPEAQTAITACFPAAPEAPAE